MACLPLAKQSIAILLNNRENDAKAVLLKVVQRCESKDDGTKNFVLIAPVDYKIPHFLRENRNFHLWAQPMFDNNRATEKKCHCFVIF